MKDILLIILLQLAYVPMLTLRTICMVKNLTILTSLFGFLESLIYIFGLAIIFNGEQSIIEMLVYALGFGIGLALGIFIEKKLAIGYLSIQVIINNRNDIMIALLRDFGFGVTIYQGEGKDGSRYRLEILAKRNREKELMNLINKHEPKAFIISYEPTRFKGGFLTKVMSKRRENMEKGLTVGELQENIKSQRIRNTYKKILFEIKEMTRNQN